MNTLIIIIGLAILGLLIFIAYKLLEKKPENNQYELKIFEMMDGLRKELSDSHGKSRVELQERLDKINEMMSKSQFQSSQTMQAQFKESKDIITKLTSEITQVKEGNKQVLDVSKQIKSLEDILKNPKQRGILGEYFLEQILSNVLPVGSYEFQYEIRQGFVVDAIIKVGDKVIPIDSKFSLENYNRIIAEEDMSKREEYEKAFKQDLKNRIDETAKYVQPENGTYDFAFMFIPSETIYYDLLVNSVGAVKVNTRDLIEYASKDKKVLIVSPNTFYAYLQTVLHGFKAMEFEQKSKEIFAFIETLGRHINAYNENMTKLGNHLGTTVNAYNNASKEFKKIDKDVYKITEGTVGGEIEVLEIDKPSFED